MWFTDHHPDMCSIHPTQRWLEQAASLLVHDYNSKVSALNSSDYVLKNYSLQAIADFIIDQREENLGFDSKMMITPVLNDILNISKTREEGSWVRGTLFFIDPNKISNFLLRFLQPMVFQLMKECYPQRTWVYYITCLSAIENNFQ